MDSIGFISLDLIIKENIQGQLNAIKKNIEISMSKPVEKSVEHLRKSMSEVNKGLTDAFKIDVNKTVAPLEEFKAKAKASADTVAKDTTERINSIKPAEIPIRYKQYNQAEIMKEIEAMTPKPKAKLEEIGASAEETRKRISEIGNFEIASDPTERLKQQIELTIERIELAQQKWKELSQTADNLSSEDIASGKGEKITAELNGTESTILSLKNKLDGLYQSLEKSEKPVKRLNVDFSKVKSIAGNVAAKIKKTMSGAFSALKKTASKAIDSVKSHLSGLKNSVGGLSSPLKKLGKSIKSAAKSALLMAGLYAVFRGLKSAVTDACNNNDAFAKSLNEIKANLQIAFAPIISSVMPAINSLTSGISQATKYLAAFTSELFDSTYKKSLETVKQIKGVSKESKKASQSLAGFDEINTLNKSDSSSGTEKSGVDYSAIDTNVKLPDFAKRLKDAVKSGDWGGVGALLAEKVNSVFNIDWGTVQDKVNSFFKNLTDGLNGFIGKINWSALGASLAGGINTVFSGIYTFMSTFDWGGFGKGIADFLNNAIKKTDWKLIGRTLASKWNALINTLFSFVSNFDFSEFGKSIGDSVNAWFDEIDWGKLGETISESIKGLLDSIISFLQTVDWQSIGQKLWECISSIDWSGIVAKLFEAIGSAIGALVSILWGFIQDAVHSIGDYFKEKIQDCGGNIVEGLFKGIGDALKSVGQWIKDKIFTPFINGFKNVFGIHSPSTVMAEMGDFIIEGLRNGISSAIKKIKEVFTKVLGTIKNIFVNIGDWFGEKFGEAWQKIKDVFSGIKTFFSGIWDNIKKIFGDIGSKIGEAVSGAFKTALNGAIAAIEGAVNLVPKAINGAINLINKLPGVEISQIPEIKLPRLAKGGVVTAPTLAMVGEAGAEAVMPLENNTGWIDKLAEKLSVLISGRNSDGGDIYLQLIVDENALDGAIIKAHRRQNIRSGGRI